MNDNYMMDKAFLEQLDKYHHREVFAKIITLDFNENPLEEVQGKITSGSINIDGASAVRRTFSLTMVAQEVNLSDYEWGLNTKIQLFVGLRNYINPKYPEIIWFKEGIYVITTLNISQSTNNYTINISGKDKMCLLNGEVGGAINSLTVDFSYYYDYDTNGYLTKVEIPVKNIIYEVVHTYAKESSRNIIINDVEDYGFELLENRSNNPIYYLVDAKNQNDIDQVFVELSDDLVQYNETTGEVSSIKDDLANITYLSLNGIAVSEWKTPTPIYERINEVQLIGPYFLRRVDPGMTCGYRICDLVYPGELIGSLGGNICTQCLDKIVGMLGSYEYFYNIDGQFVFQKKDVLIQTPNGLIEQRRKDFDVEIDITNKPFLGSMDVETNDSSNDFIKIDEPNSTQANDYQQTYIDIEVKFTDIVYHFEDSNLITAFSNSPALLNLRNDFSIWGTKKGMGGEDIPIHLRFAIDKKPTQYTSIQVTADEAKTYAKRYGFTYGEGGVLEQGNKTYTVDDYDWREIIYQMAVDYDKWNHLDDFELKIMQANGELYPGGITGYEHYYTDLISFWRLLYNPMEMGDDAKNPSWLKEPIGRTGYTYYTLENNSLTGLKYYSAHRGEDVVNIKPLYKSFSEVYSDVVAGNVTHAQISETVNNTTSIEYKELGYGYDELEDGKKIAYISYITDGSAPQKKPIIEKDEEQEPPIENPPVDGPNDGGGDISDTPPEEEQVTPTTQVVTGVLNNVQATNCQYTSYSLNVADGQNYTIIHNTNGNGNVDIANMVNDIQPASAPEFNPSVSNGLINYNGDKLTFDQTIHYNSNFYSFNMQPAIDNHTAIPVQINCDNSELAKTIILNNTVWGITTPYKIYTYYSGAENWIRTGVFFYNDEMYNYLIPQVVFQGYGDVSALIKLDGTIKPLVQPLTSGVAGFKTYRQLEIGLSDKLTLFDKGQNMIVKQIDKNYYIFIFDNAEDYYASIYIYNTNTREVTERNMGSYANVINEPQGVLKTLIDRENNANQIQPLPIYTQDNFLYFINYNDDTYKVFEYQYVNDTFNEIANGSGQIVISTDLNRPTAGIGAFNQWWYAIVERDNKLFIDCGTNNQVISYFFPSSVQTTFNDFALESNKYIIQVDLTNKVLKIADNVFVTDLPNATNELIFFAFPLQQITKAGMVRAAASISDNTLEEEDGNTSSDNNQQEQGNINLSVNESNFKPFDANEMPIKVVLEDGKELIKIYQSNYYTPLLFKQIDVATDENNTAKYEFYSILNNHYYTQPYYGNYQEIIRGYSTGTFNENMKYFIKDYNDDYVEFNIFEWIYPNVHYYTSNEFDPNSYWSNMINTNPEQLVFWFDFLSGHNELEKYSVKVVGDRPKTINDNNITAIYFQETPTVVVAPTAGALTEDAKVHFGQGYTYISLPNEYQEYFSISAQYKSAWTVLQECLDMYSYCIESANITALPVYYLEPNTKIYINDEKSGVNGEYRVDKITLPLAHNGTMSVTATKLANGNFDGTNVSSAGAADNDQEIDITDWPM